MHITAEVIPGSHIDMMWRDSNFPSGLISGVRFFKQGASYVADGLKPADVAELGHNSNVRIVTTTLEVEAEEPQGEDEDGPEDNSESGTQIPRRRGRPPGGFRR